MYAGEGDGTVIENSSYSNDCIINNVTAVNLTAIVDAIHPSYFLKWVNFLAGNISSWSKSLSISRTPSNSREAGGSSVLYEKEGSKYN